MALLGTFVNSGTQSLAAGYNCIAHGIVGFAEPDFATYQLKSLVGASSASIPIFLASLSAALVIWRNNNGAGVPGDHFVILLHNIIR